MELTVDQSLQLGIAAHNAGNIQEAERLYRAVLQSQPMHPQANHSLGLIAVSLGESEIALALFKTALDINPSIETFWVSYIDALIKGRQFKDAKRFIKKAKKAGFVGQNFKALGVQVTKTILAYEKGDLLPFKSPREEDISRMVSTYQNGQYEMARDLALSISKLFPDYSLSWKILGAIFSQTGQMEEALSAQIKSVRLDPKDAEAHNNMSVTLKSLGRLDESQESCRRAIAIKPDFFECHNNLGNVLKALGRIEAAEASYSKAINVNPDYAEAHSNLGILLLQLGRLEQAEASCRQAIVLKPGIAEVHYNLGVLLQQLGELEQAELSYKLAIAIRPEYSDSIVALAYTLNEMGKRDESVLNFKKSHNFIRGESPLDPFHKSFRTISKAKMDHDIEQFQYLADSGCEVERFEGLAKLYAEISLEIDWGVEDCEITLSTYHQALLKDTYNRPINVLQASALDAGALNDMLEREEITRDYFSHDHGLTYIDNFLTPSALHSVRQFLLGSTIWNQLKKGGYVGAYLNDGLACPLLLQIADDLRANFPDIFKSHQLKQLWAYKYDSRAHRDNNGLTGIKPHADFAAVNVNFWITPADANLNPETGGLVIYNTPAPLEWNFSTYNLNQEKLLEHIEESAGEKSVVPYNENRVVIFNSNLIHETDSFEFKEGYENRRINVTMLFGHREG